MKVIDLTGQTFGLLTVIGRAPATNKKEARWLCECSCGESTTCGGYDLRTGHTTSCGCLRSDLMRARKTKHGHARRGADGRGKSSEYEIWCSMIKRCENPNNHAYSRYGGRGITVCPEWRSSFAAFLRDVGPRPSPDLSLDRINNDGNYEPGNVRWATAVEQAQNRRPSRSKS